MHPSGHSDKAKLQLKGFFFVPALQGLNDSLWIGGIKVETYLVDPKNSNKNSKLKKKKKSVHSILESQLDSTTADHKRLYN